MVVLKPPNGCLHQAGSAASTRSAARIRSHRRASASSPAAPAFYWVPGSNVVPDQFSKEASTPPCRVASTAAYVSDDVLHEGEDLGWRCAPLAGREEGRRSAAAAAAPRCVLCLQGCLQSRSGVDKALLDCLAQESINHCLGACAFAMHMSLGPAPPTTPIRVST